MTDKHLKLAEVVDLPCATTLELPPDRVLNAAAGKLDSVFILGVDKDGELYFASSNPDRFTLLWLLRKAEETIFETATYEPDNP
jgi:uncharacterized ParB-like nuclease family protein